MEDDDTYEDDNVLVLRFVETKSDRTRAPLGVDRLEFEDCMHQTR